MEDLSEALKAQTLTSFRFWTPAGQRTPTVQATQSPYPKHEQPSCSVLPPYPTPYHSLIPAGSLHKSKTSSPLSSGSPGIAYTHTQMLTLIHTHGHITSNTHIYTLYVKNIFTCMQNKTLFSQTHTFTDRHTHVNLYTVKHPCIYTTVFLFSGSKAWSSRF